MAAALSRDVPVSPDRDEARDWLMEELSRSEYRQAQPSLLDRLGETLLRWLGRLADGVATLEPAWGILVLAAVAAAVIATAVGFARPRRRAHAPRTASVFDGGPDRSAATHRQEAARAAAQGRLDVALTETLRAVIRDAEERGVVGEQPGRTAAEVAAELQEAFGAAAADVSWLAGRFSEVRYGGEAATGPDLQRARALDAALQQAAPRSVPVPARAGRPWEAPL
jgi:hypothetical protein